VAARQIRIRGLRVHNLKNIDIDIPLRQLTVISGVSGSGKSSLAFDTLFAEGQRRYVETFSPYTRQFLERLDRPDADLIESIPPAIAIRQRARRQGARATVGSVTEIDDYLRLLFARAGRVVCPGCGATIQPDSPESVVEALTQALRAGPVWVTFPLTLPKARGRRAYAANLRADGFTRLLLGNTLTELDDRTLDGVALDLPVRGIVDRLAPGQSDRARLIDSVETAFQHGDGRCDLVRWEAAASAGGGTVRATQCFSRRWRCEPCGRDFPEPDPNLFHPRSSLGACPTCRGFGDVSDVDMELVVPDPSKSLRGGAIAPWNTPAYEHELHELTALAEDYGISLDVPFADLDDRQRRLLWEGVRDRQFGGLRGFFDWLERHRYKPQIRAFLSRWRSYRRCPDCHGARLRPDALCSRIGDRNIAELLAMQVTDSLAYLDGLTPTWADQPVAARLVSMIRQRLLYLDRVGVGYLALDRPVRTLSSGESQRVALTRALGSGLVNTLYVLDEPTAGLHRRDADRLAGLVRELCDQQNTVVLVEHDRAFIRTSDFVVDLGPGAGESGGRVVFCGASADLLGAPQSLTADFLSGRRQIVPPSRRRSPRGWLQLRGARGHNLKNLDVKFPLGVLCVVSGVSGSGKSTLVEETLYRGVSARLGRGVDRPAPHDDIVGLEQISDCLLIDQGSLGRSCRSNPVTYVGAFDGVRRAFAETGDAKLRNFGPGHFSFNVAGGRCPACDGQGVQEIDMQFLADITVTCPVCAGRRFTREVLDIKYRGRNIAEVLDLTVREAIEFFRGKPDIQERLQSLAAVGLDYLRLGQPTSTLSGGETQRLKLAEQMAATARPRSLLILNEPTRGLHPADMVCLLDCFKALLDVGHSLVVVEHQLDVIRAADWVIDLGPEAAAAGGTVMACGTPEQVAAVPESRTGTCLVRQSPPH
jgi:excinuclease ABC subunit A